MGLSFGKSSRNNAAFRVAADAIKYLEPWWQESLNEGAVVDAYSGLAAAASIWAGAVLARWFPEKFPQARSAWNARGSDGVVDITEVLALTSLGLYLHTDDALERAADLMAGGYAASALTHKSGLKRRPKFVAKLISEALECDESQGASIFSELDIGIKMWLSNQNDSLPFVVYWRSLAALNGIWIDPHPGPALDSAGTHIQWMLDCRNAGYSEFSEQVLKNAIEGHMYVGTWLPLAVRAVMEYMTEAERVGRLTFPFA
jgi:hypothetical protein